MGKSPQWVMESMTVDQAVLCFRKIGEQKLRDCEMQGAIVCQMLSGEYKREAKKKPFNPDELRGQPFFEEK